MKTITFVTGNESKLKDAQKFLSSDELEVIARKLELLEIQSHSQEEIVTHKVKQAHTLAKTAVIVDDTSFYIDLYPGFPGTLTKHVNSLLGLEGIIKLYDEGQSAYFLTMLCYKDENEEVIAKGVSKGRLTKKISNIFNPDAPLNSIFIPDGYDRPLSELSFELGLGNIHRLNAFKDLKEKIYT